MIDEKNDLINNINGNEDKKLRKYLFIGGSVFILFVIVVVVSKFLFSSDKEDTKVILPTEIKQPKVEKEKDTNLFKDIPVDDNTAVIDENQFKKPEENTQAIEEVKKPEVQEVKPVQVKQEIKKDIVTQNTQKNVDKQKVAHNKYYIQVAAIIRTSPSKSFLHLIKRNGFDYTIVEVNIKGNNVKRVLVGPYNSYNKAREALLKVRKTISSSAFIKRVKWNMQSLW